MQVLVVGGTGMLGEPVARHLLAQGNTVRILTRRPDAAAERFREPFDLVGGDIEDTGALARAIAGCDAVHVSLDGKGDWDLERRGAEAVAAAARGAGVQRISIISGASVSEENTWFPMIAAKLAAEQAIVASNVPYAILRCTMFMEMLPKLVRGSKAMVMGDQPNPWHFVAADDYARMVGEALTNPEAANKVFLVLGPEALTLEQALAIYVRECAPEATVSKVPFGVLRILSWLPGKRELRRVGLPVMSYFARARELGSPDEANRLLGAPTTTVEAWCQGRAGQAKTA